MNSEKKLINYIYNVKHLILSPFQASAFPNHMAYLHFFCISFDISALVVC